MTTQAAALPVDRRDGLETAVHYLTSHCEFLRYDHALEQGWPIATGVIEGTARHLVGDRLEITGARWGLAGAEAILKFRAVISNVTWTPAGPITSTANNTVSNRPATSRDTPSLLDHKYCRRTLAVGVYLG
ncbi:hypothetical protein [Nonomuraea sp. 160415]|uniref:hypothetical protein n=1 Tax=Nonomuraea basaltis TaxID=2495887 RepID=UPI00110C40B6|nr:hypothetical protein EJK15_61585 [Nonomuraea basaltis]